MEVELDYEDSGDMVGRLIEALFDFNEATRFCPMSDLIGGDLYDVASSGFSFTQKGKDISVRKIRQAD